MKYTIALLAMAMLVFGSCEDFEDDNYDFSNNLAQYVEFASGADAVAEAGTELVLTVRMREALNVPVVVAFEIAGDLSSLGTTTIASGEISAPIPLAIPSDPPSGTATITLTGVDNNLSLGRGGPDAGLSPIERVVSW